jgi:cytidylate kinase
LRERDRIDSTRAVAPLRPAADAVVIDSDGKDIDQVFELVLEIVCSRQKQSS